MKILIEALSIAFAVFPNSVELMSPKKVHAQFDKPKNRAGSPSRLPLQVWVPGSPPSTSYDKYSSPPPSPPKRKYGTGPPEISTKNNSVPLNKAIQALKTIGVSEKTPIPHNLFYTENKKFRRVTSLDGLVQRNDYFIGKLNKDNIIAPVANHNGMAVIHHIFDHTQHEISSKQAEEFGIMDRLLPTRLKANELPSEVLKDRSGAMRETKFKD